MWRRAGVGGERAAPAGTIRRLGRVRDRHTFNTINKLAAGISDNYALGVVAECIGAGVPVVILPFINSALASRTPLRTSVATLRAEGVRVLLGEDGFTPHPPRHGGDHIERFPWHAALAEAKRLIDR